MKEDIYKLVALYLDHGCLLNMKQVSKEHRRVTTGILEEEERWMQENIYLEFDALKDDLQKNMDNEVFMNLKSEALEELFLACKEALKLKPCREGLLSRFFSKNMLKVLKDDDYRTFLFLMICRKEIGVSAVIIANTCIDIPKLMHAYDFFYGEFGGNSFWFSGFKFRDVLFKNDEDSYVELYDDTLDFEGTVFLGSCRFETKKKGVSLSQDSIFEFEEEGLNFSIIDDYFDGHECGAIEESLTEAHRHAWRLSRKLSVVEDELALLKNALKKANQDYERAVKEIQVKNEQLEMAYQEIKENQKKEPKTSDNFMPLFKSVSSDFGDCSEGNTSRKKQKL